MDRINLTLEGVLNARSEIHVTAFNQGNTHVTNTMTRPIAATWSKSDESQILNTKMPFVPGNSLRGRIRRMAADQIKAALIDGDHQISRGAYYLATVGSTASAGSVGDYNAGIHDRVYADPFLGIFGAETMYPSRLITADMIPIGYETKELDMVPSVYAEQAGAKGELQLYRYLSNDRFMTRRDDFQNLSDQRAPSVVSDYVETLEAYNHKVRKADKSRKQAKAGEVETAEKKADMSNMMALETIISGTPFYWNARLNNVTRAQAGLLLHGVADAFDQLGVGSMARLGLGRVGGVLDVKIDDQAVGNLNIDTGDEVMTGVAADLGAEGLAAVEGYTPELLEAIAGNRKEAA